jgi:hypothetical protein
MRRTEHCYYSIRYPLWEAPTILMCTAGLHLGAAAGKRDDGSVVLHVHQATAALAAAEVYLTHIALKLATAASQASLAAAALQEHAVRQGLKPESPCVLPARRPAGNACASNNRMQPAMCVDGCPSSYGTCVSVPQRVTPRMRLIPASSNQHPPTTPTTLCTLQGQFKICPRVQTTCNRHVPCAHHM